MTNIHHRDDPRWREPHIPGRVIVELVPGHDARKYDAILRRHKAREAKHLATIGRHVIECDPDEIQPLLDELEQERLLVDAEPDGLLQAGGDTEFGDSVEGRAYTPNDPLLSRQWHINNIRLPDAWSITQGADSVKVAIIDSGAYSHPELTPNILPGYNCIAENSNTADTGALGGHGTATAGTAGAAMGNGLGIAGVARCKLMPFVVLAANNYAAWSDVAQALTMAADQGCRVMNISIGGTGASSTLDRATAYAWNKGAIIFASAMNNHNSIPNYPAACQNVMAVAATNSQNNLASFSNFGSWVDISAPGQAIFTTYKQSSYANWNGTSFASPICAGVAVLMLASNPNLTNSRIVLLMKQTADPVAGQPFGKVNALRAVQAARGGL